MIDLVHFEMFAWLVCHITLIPAEGKAFLQISRGHQARHQLCYVYVVSDLEVVPSQPQ